jgi:hypothetical protein
MPKHTTKRRWDNLRWLTASRLLAAAFWTAARTNTAFRILWQQGKVHKASINALGGGEPPRKMERVEMDSGEWILPINRSSWRRRNLKRTRMASAFYLKRNERHPEGVLSILRLDTTMVTRQREHKPRSRAAACVAASPSATEEMQFLH